MSWLRLLSLRYAIHGRSGRMTGAFGADDVATLPRLTFRKLRVLSVVSGRRSGARQTRAPGPRKRKCRRRLHSFSPPKLGLGTDVTWLWRRAEVASSSGSVCGKRGYSRSRLWDSTAAGPTGTVDFPGMKCYTFRITMRFEWDSGKDRVNRKKTRWHRVRERGAGY